MSSSKLKAILKECEEGETMIDDFLKKTEVRPSQAPREAEGRGEILENSHIPRQATTAGD